LNNKSEKSESAKIKLKKSLKKTFLIYFEEKKLKNILRESR